MTIISCGRHGENCIYLIPKGFEGNLIIIFEQNDGNDTSYDKQTRLYNFDKSGVLKTKFKPNYGTQQKQYYYVDSLGNKINIAYRLPSDPTDGQEPIVLNIEPGNDFDTIKKRKRHFELFTVARQYHVDSIAELRSKFMWQSLRQ